MIMRRTLSLQIDISQYLVLDTSLFIDEREQAEITARRNTTD